MQLYSILGGTEEELMARGYTLGVGISLGNKWFTVENILGLIGWSLQYTKDDVIVYVADSIHAINLEIRNDKSPQRAAMLADEMGTKILSEVKEGARQILSTEDFNKLVFVKWKDIETAEYKKKVEFLYEFFRLNQAFHGTIISIVENITSRETRKFSDSQIERLGHYIIEELPELICRVEMAGVVCDAYAYPFSGELVPLVEKIQKGQIFPEIKEMIMDTEPKVFLEVR